MYAERKLPPLPDEDWYRNEEEFLALCPPEYQDHNSLHWTPLSIVERSVQFLSDRPDPKILDIGSGIGKFCLAGSKYNPNASFYGVEHREHFDDFARHLKKKLKLGNVHFINGNFIDLDFSDYTGFYFFNAFFENLEDVEKIDETVMMAESLFTYYNSALKAKLDVLATGTRFISFHSLDEEIPSSYKLVEQDFNGRLKFWEKG